MKIKILIAIFIAFLTGCTEEKGTNSNSPLAVDTLSFASDIMPIFEAHCIECHGELWPDGDYDMTSYDMVINSGLHAPNVIPGKPDSSYLIHVISPDDTTGHDGPYPQTTVIEPIYTWIDQGALNN